MKWLESLQCSVRQTARGAQAQWYAQMGVLSSVSRMKHFANMGIKEQLQKRSVLERRVPMKVCID